MKDFSKYIKKNTLRGKLARIRWQLGASIKSRENAGPQTQITENTLPALNRPDSAKRKPHLRKAAAVSLAAIMAASAATITAGCVSGTSTATQTTVSAAQDNTGTDSTDSAAGTGDASSVNADAVSAEGYDFEFTASDLDTGYDLQNDTVITADGSGATVTGSGKSAVTVDGSTITITAEGTYIS